MTCLGHVKWNCCFNSGFERVDCKIGPRKWYKLGYLFAAINEAHASDLFC